MATVRNLPSQGSQSWYPHYADMDAGLRDVLSKFGVDGKLLSAILPAIAINDVFPVASQAAMLALNAQRGDMAIRTDMNPSGWYVLASDSAATLADWKPVSSAIDTSGLLVKPTNTTNGNTVIRIAPNNTVSLIPETSFLAALLPLGDEGQVLGWGETGLTPVDTVNLATDAPPYIDMSQAASGVGTGDAAMHANARPGARFPVDTDQTGSLDPEELTWVTAVVQTNTGPVAGRIPVLLGDPVTEEPPPGVSGAFTDLFDRPDSTIIGNGWYQSGEIELVNGAPKYVGPDTFAHGATIWRKVNLESTERLKYVGVRINGGIPEDDAWYGDFLFGWSVNGSNQLYDGYGWASNRLYARGIPDEPNAPVYAGFSPTQGMHTEAGVRYNADGTFNLMVDHTTEAGGEWGSLVGLIPRDASHLWFGFSIGHEQASHFTPSFEFIVEVEAL